jgi:hypothetical protein
MGVVAPLFGVWDNFSDQGKPFGSCAAFKRLRERCRPLLAVCAVDFDLAWRKPVLAGSSA